MATYANQIQDLTLRNAKLEAHNARLLERLRHLGENVAVLLALIPPLPLIWCITCGSHRRRRCDYAS